MQRQFIALLYGWIFILVFILVSSFILTLIVQFTGIRQQTLSWVAFSVGLIGLFIGGMITGIKGKSKGWIIGGLTGLGFTVFIFLVQFLGYQNGFSLDQTLHHLGFILAAILGGMIGVNLINRQE